MVQAFFVFAAVLLSTMAARGEEVIVSAAISLQPPLEQIARDYEQHTGRRVRLNFGSSGQLAAQIRQGALVNLFISADEHHVRQLIDLGFVNEGSQIIAHNRLALIAPVGHARAIGSLDDLAHASRIAIGDPQTVPAGRYAMQVLQRRELAETLRERLIFGTNVRQVLTYAQRGEVDAAIVYLTDARAAGDGVRVIEIIADRLHESIVYIAAIIRPSPAAERFLQELRGPAAQALLREHGFTRETSTAAPDEPPPAPLRARADDLLPPLLMSLRVALLATALTVLIGTPLAFVLARRQFAGKTFIETVLTVPLVLPPTVVGYLLILIFGAHGFVGRWLDQWWGLRITFTEAGAVLAAVVVSLPLLYLPAKGAFAAVERELEEIALLMGAGPLRTFWHVSLPIARRGIASGVLLAFARALGEFGATVMVLGNFADRHTLPISIYNHFEAGQLERAMPVVVLLSAVSLGVIFLYNRSGLTRPD